MNKKDLRWIKSYLSTKSAEARFKAKGMLLLTAVRHEGLDVVFVAVGRVWVHQEDHPVRLFTGKTNTSLSTFFW